MAAEVAAARERDGPADVGAAGQRLCCEGGDGGLELEAVGNGGCGVGVWVGEGTGGGVGEAGWALVRAASPRPRCPARVTRVGDSSACGARGSHCLEVTRAREVRGQWPAWAPLTLGHLRRRAAQQRQQGQQQRSRSRAARRRSRPRLTQGHAPCARAIARLRGIQSAARLHSTPALLEHSVNVATPRGARATGRARGWCGTSCCCQARDTADFSFQKHRHHPCLLLWLSAHPREVRREDRLTCAQAFKVRVYALRVSICQYHPTTLLLR